MDDKLTTKTAKFTFLKNLYVYGKLFIVQQYHIWLDMQLPLFHFYFNYGKVCGSKLRGKFCS